MRTTQSLSITLPIDMAQMVKDRVTNGEYASESEVIRDGLRALAARDAAEERWLREDVLPTLTAHDAGSGQASPLEDVRRRLHRRVDDLAAKVKPEA